MDSVRERLLPLKAVAVIGAVIFVLSAAGLSMVHMNAALDHLARTIADRNGAFAAALTEVLRPDINSLLARAEQLGPAGNNRSAKIERVVKGTGIVNLTILDQAGRVLWTKDGIEHGTERARTTGFRLSLQDDPETGGERYLVISYHPFTMPANQAERPGDTFSGAYEIETDVSDHISQIGSVLLPVLAILALSFGVIFLFLFAIVGTSNRRLVENYRQQRRLSHSVKRAEEADQAKSAFMSEISHELRTPLNAIIGFSELLKDGAFGPLGDKRYQSYAEDIHQGGRQLLTILTDLLDLGRIQSGQMELNERQMDLAACLETTTRMLSCQPEAVALTFKCEMEANLPPVFADPDAIQHIMQDLLSNAIRHTIDGTITVAARLRPDQTLEFSVSDTGIGVPENELERFRIILGHSHPRRRSSSIPLV
jgi:signal transduction histidine kinase